MLRFQAMETYAANDSAPPPKPEPPVEGCCCKGGCFPCVWDYYKWALEDWEKQCALAHRPSGNN